MLFVVLTNEHLGPSSFRFFFFVNDFFFIFIHIFEDDFKEKHLVCSFYPVVLVFFLVCSSVF